MTMRKVWKVGGSICFYDVGRGIMLAEFDEHYDKQRVLHDGSWNFDKRLLLTQEFEGGMQVRDIDIKETSFWVRILNLPLMARNERVGELVGATMGVFEEVDLKQGEIKWGEYMRIQVHLDVTKPFHHQKNLALHPTQRYGYILL